MNTNKRRRCYCSSCSDSPKQYKLVSPSTYFNHKEEDLRKVVLANNASKGNNILTSFYIWSVALNFFF